jgi:hypothetical protein
MGARLPLLIFVSMFLQILGDAPFQHDDAYPHLFPLPNWKFQSQISYCYPDHYGGIVAPLEAILFSSCCAVMARRASSSSARLLMAFVVVLYVVYGGYVFLVWPNLKNYSVVFASIKNDLLTKEMAKIL